MKKKITECKKGDTFAYQAIKWNEPTIITLESDVFSVCKKLNDLTAKEKVCARITTPIDFLYPDFILPNSGLRFFEKDLEVNVLHNLYDLGEEKCSEIYRKYNYRTHNYRCKSFTNNI